MTSEKIIKLLCVRCRARVSICIRGWGGGGMIGAKIFSAMDQSNHEVEECGKLHPSQARSQDFILGGGSEHAKRGP